MKSIANDIVQVLLALRRSVRCLVHHGDARYCSLCGSSFRVFRSTGNPPRPDAECWYCGSLERHRFLHYLLTTHTRLKATQGTCVHIAPEPSLLEAFRSRCDHYVSLDLLKGGVSMYTDLTALPFKNCSIDRIVCNHVLEHIEDDAAAMEECRRVLKKSGHAILSVPIKGDETYENAKISSAEDRLRHFGQKDHVRWYGRDFIARLQNQGFRVTELTAADFLSADEMLSLGLGPGTGSFFCAEK